MSSIYEPTSYGIINNVNKSSKLFESNTELLDYLGTLEGHEVELHTVRVGFRHTQQFFTAREYAELFKVPVPDWNPHPADVGANFIRARNTQTGDTRDFDSYEVLPVLYYLESLPVADIDYTVLEVVLSNQVVDTYTARAYAEEQGWPLPEPLQLMSPAMARFCEGVMALADHVHVLCKFHEAMSPHERSALCRVDAMAAVKLSQDTGVSVLTIHELAWANYRGMKKAGFY